MQDEDEDFDFRSKLPPKPAGQNMIKVSRSPARSSYDESEQSRSPPPYNRKILIR